MADTVEERLAALEDRLTKHIESTGDDPYRIATVEQDVAELLEALLSLVGVVTAMAKGSR